MAKLLRNITLEIIRLNRIDSLYDPQSIVITYYEQNLKRGRALLFLISKLFGFKWESGVTVFVVIRPHCGLWSGLYTYLQCWVLRSVQHWLQWCYNTVLCTTLYCPGCHHNKGLFILHSVRWLGASANMYFSL